MSILYSIDGIRRTAVDKNKTVKDMGCEDIMKKMHEKKYPL